MPNKTGQRGAWLQPKNFGLTANGPFQVWTYEGTRQEVAALVPQVLQTGGTYEIQESFTGQNDKLTARWSFIPGSTNPDQDIVNTWEFFANENEKDLLQSDLTLVNLMSRGDKKLWRQLLQDPDQINDALAAGGLFSNGPANAGIGILLDQALGGLTSVRVFQPILRHTQTVTNRWTIPASQTNVKKVISTASLISLEAIPNDVLFQLPNNATTKEGFSYGWFKKFPTTRTSARQRTQLEQEWEYGLYSNLVYGNPL